MWESLCSLGFRGSWGEEAMHQVTTASQGERVSTKLWRLTGMHARWPKRYRMPPVLNCACCFPCLQVCDTWVDPASPAELLATPGFAQVGREVWSKAGHAAMHSV